MQNPLTDLNLSLPDWAETLLVVACALAAAWFAHAFFYRLLTRFLGSRSAFLDRLLRNMRGPLKLIVLIAALSAASTIAPLTETERSVIRHILLAGLITTVVWLVRMALNLWAGLHLKRFKIDVEDNMLARKHVTQSRILLRAADTVLVVIGLAAVLMTFDPVRQYGVSLLASAGAAGIVVGLALQPMLKNLFAGVQLSLTQPIRIDDAVIVEGEWGNIEEITATYVVVRIWDRRRLIVPLNYFMEQPFQNWTREEARLIGAVLIYLDYSTPVAAVRKTVEEIVDRSRNWDRDVVAVQVTDFRETVMEVRILASAGNAGRAFDLRCEIREHLVSWLAEEFPHSLPRTRNELRGGDTTGDREEDGHRLHA